MFSHLLVAIVQPPHRVNGVDSAGVITFVKEFDNNRLSNFDNVGVAAEQPMVDRIDGRGVRGAANDINEEVVGVLVDGNGAPLRMRPADYTVLNIKRKRLVNRALGFDLRSQGLHGFGFPSSNADFTSSFTRTVRKPRRVRE